MLQVPNQLSYSEYEARQENGAHATLQHYSRRYLGVLSLGAQVVSSKTGWMTEPVSCTGAVAQAAFLI